ncbi:cilia- and flagella-associated protein 69-like [Apostichopus japonicus]|uniref:cilia- and flagella-associated protein 69-like n=1 Tax=Stichopus japonicus TaxID=307972 RepID=UPI003AB183BF
MATEDVLTKPAVPVVGHVITDDDIGVKQGIKIQAINFNKVFKLLTDPHSTTLYDRHFHALQRLIRHYKSGLLLKDLVQAFKIINVCADRAASHSDYLQPMQELLKICSLPFLKEKSSDETVYSQIVVESISQLGYLMRVPNRDIKLELANTILSIYTQKPSSQKFKDQLPCSQAYNIAMLEKSDVAETLVKSLSLLEQDLEVKLCLMNVLQHLSSFSTPNCDKMLSADAASRIASRMNDPDPSGRLLFRSIEILWNLIENGNREEVSRQLNSLVCLNALKDAFSERMTQGYSHYDRQLRNDLLVISTLVASSCPEAPFIETGYAKQLMLFGTFQEVRSHNALVKYLKLGTNPEDFELKKLLISMLVVLSKEPATVPLISESNVILAMLSYIHPNENTSQAQEWSPAQFEEIQLHVMAALCTLGPLCVQDYIDSQGSTRLLLLLEWCVGKDDFAGHGNSFHGLGGRGNKRAQMRYCLHLMRSMVSLRDSSVNQDLTDQGAINQILDILQSATRSDMPDDAIDVEMQCDMLYILSVLCDGEQHRKELFGEKGVDSILRYLKTNPKKLFNGLGHHRMMLATLGAIWCCIVGATINEDQFLEGEGIFLLLDLLQNAARSMHNLILGCLTDLCENAKSVSHLSTWRGSSDQTVGKLLIRIWKEEEKELGVMRKEDGTIADTNKPLIGTLQDSEGVTPLPANSPSQSIVDISENMRAKLYALLYKLGFEELQGLSAEDQVTLCIIERYMDFKQGEVWSEITEELTQEGVRPVTPDQEALAVIGRASQELASLVIDMQEEILESETQHDLLEEQELYSQIRENHKQAENTLEKWQDYVARTSNYELLKSAKKLQDLSIHQSREEVDNSRERGSFHDTDLTNLQTTTFQGRQIRVDSTPQDILNESTMRLQTQEKTRAVTLQQSNFVFAQ